MCAPLMGASSTRTGRNILNDLPIAGAYKAVSGGQTLSQGINKGNAFIGMTGALLARQNKKNPDGNNINPFNTTGT